MSSRVVPRLGPDLVGQRVVVRRRLGGGRVGDLLGELLAWDADGDGLVRVRTRHGEVAVAISEVVAGKAVPPAPTRRGAPHRALGWEQLEDVAADGWRPLELAWLGAPGQGWRLRAAEGFTGRANSALAVGDPGLPLEAAVDAVEAWYGERGLPARFGLPWPLDARAAPAEDDGPPARDSAVDTELRARGYALDTPTLVLTAAPREVAAAVVVPGQPGLPADLELTLDDEPDDDWLAVYRYRGQELPPVARRLLLSAPAQTFVSVRSSSGTVAVGRAASSRGWTGVSAMEVTPRHRRRGLASLVMGALAEWALERGDRSMYLQVAEKNVAAQGLYAGVGFAPHHGYHYRINRR
ncbi:GNAT family N-acetyltransferase [Angustibacter peucedani]